MTKQRGNKGRTRWFPREVKPVRHGEYECIIRFANVGHFKTTTHWDGVGFKGSMPFSLVIKWRGLTLKEHTRLMKTTK